MTTRAHGGGIPLCVDLDDTLVRGDLLVESAALLFRARPLSVLSWPLWLCAGKARLKREIAARAPLDPALLPYETRLVEWLRREKSAGRRLILVTGSDQALAQAVAGHLGLFETVLASDGERNLTRETKARVLEERFGRSGFDYAGSDRDDLPVWRRARRGVLVNAAPGVDRAARAVTEVERVFAAQTRLWAELWRAMRPYQWGKNLLVFLPLLTSHRLFDLPLFGRAALGALAFCLCASSVYLLNDLLDLPSDRAHKTKRDRPLAAGRLSSTAALRAIPVLLAASAALAALLPAKFFLTLGVYYALTLAYSLRLRSELVLDVFSLALLYSLRLLGGHVVGDIPYSPWLFGFSLFLFLSLALMKRYIELAASPAVPTHGRGYRPGDAPILKEMGVASAYIAALIFALYINSDQVVRLYARPVWLWALCVIILFALSRMWVLAQRGQVDDDPVRFVLRDRVSWAAAALAAVVLAVAGSVP